MNGITIDAKNFPMALLGLIVDLHAKQEAQTNVLIDFLSSVSNKNKEEIMDSLNIRTQASKHKILERIYAEFGAMPDDIKNWFKDNKSC